MKKKLILTLSILAILVVIIGGIIIYRNYSYCAKPPRAFLYDESVLPTPVDPEIRQRYPDLPPTIPPDPNKAIKSNPDFTKWMTRCFPHATSAGEKPKAEKPAIEKPETENEFIDRQSEQEKFDIFGEAKFDTSATGYLKIQEEETLGGKAKNAYFVITGYKDEQFIRSLKAGIERGNGVNKKEKDLYLFNLGCFKDGKITGSEYAEPYIDKETQEALLKSSTTNQVRLKLYFEPLSETDCVCCNFAHKIRILK